VPRLVGLGVVLVLPTLSIHCNASENDDVNSSLAGETGTGDAFARRRLALEGHVGFGTPVGALGFVAEYSILPFLGVGAGVGIGSGPDGGNHFHGALVTRVRPLRGRTNALVIGAAYSFGGYKRFELFIPNDQPSNYFSAQGDWAQWAQADIGWEHRWEGCARLTGGTDMNCRSPVDGLLLRLSLGAAYLLNPNALACYGAAAEACSRAPNAIFTFDIAIGYAL